MASPFEPAGDGIRVHLRVAPRASRNGITGTMPGADGRTRLKVSVTAAPEGGRANAAVMKLLARAWGVPKSSLEVVAGATDRNKVLLVSGSDRDMLGRLESWLGEHGM